MIKRSFFAWLKSWLAGAAGSVQIGPDQDLDWLDSEEGIVPSDQSAPSSAKKAAGSSALASVRAGRRTSLTRVAFLRTLSQRGSLSGWRQRSLPAASIMTSPSLTLRKEQGLSRLRSQLKLGSVVEGSSVKRLAPAFPPSELTQRLRPIVKAEEAQSVRWKRLTLAPAGRSHALQLLGQVEEAASRQDSPHDSLTPWEPQVRSTEGRPVLPSRSSPWLHLGPRLAANLPPFDL